MKDDALLEELKIRRVLERYCRWLDDGQVSDLVELFDPECTFEMLGRTFRGRDELGDVWNGVAPTMRPTMMHSITGPVISVDGDRAWAVSNWTLFDRGGEEGATRVSMAGQYHDKLARDVEGTWRFVARRVQTLRRPTQP